MFESKRKMTEIIFNWKNPSADYNGALNISLNKESLISHVSQKEKSQTWAERIAIISLVAIGIIIIAASVYGGIVLGYGFIASAFLTNSFPEFLGGYAMMCGGVIVTVQTPALLACFFEEVVFDRLIIGSKTDFYKFRNVLEIKLNQNKNNVIEITDSRDWKYLLAYSQAIEKEKIQHRKETSEFLGQLISHNPNTLHQNIVNEILGYE